MTYLMAAISAVVTGLLFALAARTLGVHHNGILLAVGIIGSGLQVILLIVWYLFYTKPRREKLARAQEPELLSPNRE